VTHPFPHVAPLQIRAARRMLGMSQSDLATMAGVGLSTVRDLESGRRKSGTNAALRVVITLHERGVAFMPADSSGGIGVRLVTLQHTKEPE